jgi:hypothetical protein
MCQSCQGTMGKMPSLFSFLFFFPGQKKKEKKKTLYTLHPQKVSGKLSPSCQGVTAFLFFIRISPLSASNVWDHNPQNRTIMHNKGGRELMTEAQL